MFSACIEDEWCTDQPTEELLSYPQVHEYYYIKPEQLTTKSIRTFSENERGEKTTTVALKYLDAAAEADDYLQTLTHKTTSAGVTFLRECRVKAWVGWVQGHSAHRTQDLTRPQQGAAHHHQPPSFFNRSIITYMKWIHISGLTQSMDAPSVT